MSLLQWNGASPCDHSQVECYSGNPVRFPEDLIAIERSLRRISLSLQCHSQLSSTGFHKKLMGRG